MAIGLIASIATPSRGDYAYVTSIVPTSQAFGSTSVVSFGAVMGGTPPGAGLTGTQNIALAAVTDSTSTTAPPTDHGVVGYTITIHLSAPASSYPTVAGTLTVVGSLDFIRSDSGGEVSFNSVNTGASTLTRTIGGETYTLTAFSYSAPTVNAVPGTPGAGSIGATISVTAVPEPASVAMLGVGGLLLVAPRLRRLVRRIARSERD
jgi:hypothetical protein